MILRGILDSSLGGLVCVRGFAPLTELAAISYADRTVQRELIPEHREQVREYMRQGDPIFFPEVILSCQLERMYRPNPGTPPENLLHDVITGNNKMSRRIGSLKFERRAISQPTQDIRYYRPLYLATLDFDEEQWRGGDERPLLRIDGNHRLSAIDDAESLQRLMTPFCVIFFDRYNSGRGYDKSIFYTINSKALPLTPEEGIREFIDDEHAFPDSRLQEDEAFGMAFVYARRLLRRLDLTNETVNLLPNLAKEFEQPRKTTVALFKYLLDKKLLQEGNAVQKVYDSLRDLEAFYARNPRLRNKSCTGLLIALVYYQIKGDKRISHVFRNWIISNHLYGLDTIEAESLIDIFVKIMESRSRTIFVSMQFSDDVETHYQMISEAVDAINREFALDIKLQKLRIDEHSEGHSYQISDKILRLIEDSGLLIADLTHPNTNVYHEVGFLMGVNQGKQLRQENFILVMRNKRDVDNDRRVGFNLRGWQQIRFNETHELRAKIKESILKYYRLAGN